MISQKSYYLTKKKKTTMGIILILFSLFPTIFLGLVVRDTSILETFIAMGWFNIIWFIFFQAGVSFLVIKKLPILIIDKEKLLYNEFYMPSGRGDGIFFILFPYTYRNLTEHIKYSNIESFQIKNNKWVFGKQLVFKLKIKPKLLRYTPVFNANTLSSNQIEELSKFLNQKIK